MAVGCPIPRGLQWVPFLVDLVGHIGFRHEDDDIGGEAVPGIGLGAAFAADIVDLNLVALRQICL